MIKMGPIAILFVMLFHAMLLCTCAKKSSKSGMMGGAKDLTVKRIMAELRDINEQGLTLADPFTNSTDECGVRLSPVGNNLLEWHFSFLGIDGTTYGEGCYHGRILLHPEYPRRAPSICLISPNGRWEVGRDICLSATAYHQETW
jgi:ubiquitin-protein ligase